MGWGRGQGWNPGLGPGAGVGVGACELGNSVRPGAAVAVGRTHCRTRHGSRMDGMSRSVVCRLGSHGSETAHPTSSIDDVRPHQRERSWAAGVCVRDAPWSSSGSRLSLEVGVATAMEVVVPAMLTWSDADVTVRCSGPQKPRVRARLEAGWRGVRGQKGGRERVCHGQGPGAGEYTPRTGALRNGPVASNVLERHDQLQRRSANDGQGRMEAGATMVRTRPLARAMHR